MGETVYFLVPDCCPSSLLTLYTTSRPRAGQVRRDALGRGTVRRSAFCLWDSAGSIINSHAYHARTLSQRPPARELSTRTAHIYLHPLNYNKPWGCSRSTVLLACDVRQRSLQAGIQTDGSGDLSTPKVLSSAGV